MLYNKMFNMTKRNVFRKECSKQGVVLRDLLCPRELLFMKA